MPSKEWRQVNKHPCLKCKMLVHRFSFYCNKCSGKKRWENPEYRKKQSEIRKGKISGAKGKHWKISEKAKRKISKAQKGKKLSLITREKIRKALSGSKNYNWKGGTYKSLNEKIRNCFKYRQWRSDIFARDNFTCILCEKRGVYLEADHFPKRFIDIINEYQIDTLEKSLFCEELWNINNGRTLCKECHRAKTLIKRECSPTLF